MNEQQLGNRIRQLLNQGLDVDAATAERLRAARERALQHQRPEPAAVIAWADHVLGRVEGSGGQSLRILAALAVLVAGLAGIYSWEQNQRIAEVEDIDAQLLADDLPVEAYLDRGFQNWLKKRAAEE